VGRSAFLSAGLYLCLSEPNLQPSAIATADFEGVGAEIIGISTDSAFSHRAWLQTPRDKGGVEGLKFPLGADITKKMSKDYGVLIEDRGIALRGLFVIDPEGVLRYKVVHDLNIGRSAKRRCA